MGVTLGQNMSKHVKTGYLLEVEHETKEYQRYMGLEFGRWL